MLSSRTGAFWSKLPVPLALVAFPLFGIFAVLVARWLASWLGGTSLLLAIVCWLAVIVGLMHAGGRLPWLNSQPWAVDALNIYAPRVRASGPGRGTRAPSTSTADVPSALTPDVSQFAGLDSVRTRLHHLIEGRDILANKVADAPLLLLLGPRGVGKTSFAQTLPARLLQAGITGADNVVAISTKELPGLSDRHGPDTQTLHELSERLAAAVDGVVLLDNLDQLVALAGGDVMHEIGGRLRELVQGHRRRVVVIGTGSIGVIDQLDPRRDWISHFDQLAVPFPALEITALEAIANRLLAEHNLSCTPAAATKLSLELDWLTEDANFINAHAVRTLVGQILNARAARLRSTPTTDPLSAKQVVESDIPNKSGT